MSICMSAAKMIKPPVTERISLARFLQRQAPKGWKITAVRHGISYQITTGDGVSATVSRPERAPGWHISEGWQVKILNTGISTEFTVTTPDGRSLFFHDCWNA
jgi:hypothetical protein